MRQVSDIERPADMRRLLNTVAAQMASLVRPVAVASALQLPSSTVKRYLDLLDLLFVLRRIPAWSTNLTTRAIATPKTVLVDSGLAGHLAGITERRANRPEAPVGPLVENFALGELCRQLSWATEPVRIHHYRDRDGYEVDAVPEHAGGEIVAIEVKAAETVRSEDFRGHQSPGQPHRRPSRCRDRALWRHAGAAVRRAAACVADLRSLVNLSLIGY